MRNQKLAENPTPFHDCGISQRNQRFSGGQGPREVPGGSSRVPGGQDGVLDGSGGFEEDIWRGPGSHFFCFFGGEFAHGIMKY